MTKPTPAGRQLAGRELSTAAVVQAASALIRAGGLDGFSMRLLGAELNVSATALYYHVGSKDTLLDAVFQEALASLGDVGHDLPWADGLEELLVQLQYLAAQYQGIWGFLADHLDSGATFQWMELILRMLARGGFAGDDAAAAIVILSFYNSPVSLRRKGHMGAGVWEEVPAEKLSARAEELRAVYPLLAGVQPFRQGPDEALFRRGVRSLIAGLRKA